MPLRRSPVPTPRALAVRRANALKPTGPRTAEGKQRLSVNFHERSAHPEQPQPSDAKFQTRLSVVEEELRDARKGYELELDVRTIGGAACLAEPATRREEQGFHQQGEPLRRALDRAQAMTPKLLKMLGPAEASSQTRGAMARHVGLHQRAGRRNRSKNSPCPKPIING